MKNILKIKVVAAMVALALVLSACKKNKFLDVNNNPNNPLSVDVNFVLPTAEANLGYTLGNQFAIYGGLWAQYWTQDPNANQYDAYDAYVNVPTDNDRPWTALYTTAKNLDYIIQTASTDSTKKNYGAIAYLLKAYTFQLITDAWGDVPLHEALQGAGNAAPKYDKQADIYDSLVIMVQNGLRLIDATKTLPTEDLIYIGDMSKWQKFGNTLLLKIYIRECLVRGGTSQAGITALYTQMGQDPSKFLSSPTDDANLSYSSTKYQQYPLYATSQFLQTNNLAASATAMNYLIDLNDTRTLDFYDPTGGGGYVGIIQGSGKTAAGQQSSANISHASTSEIVGPTSQVKLLSSSESEFLQAEAIVRGYLPGDASTDYYTGITNSWQTWPNSASDTSLPSYMLQDSVNFSTAVSSTDKIRFIITQKWLAMCGNQNFEAWTEWRRTGFPDVFITSVTSNLGANVYPNRLVYPSVEINNNGSFPGLQSISTRVWWDVN